MEEEGMVQQEEDMVPEEGLDMVPEEGDMATKEVIIAEAKVVDIHIIDMDIHSMITTIGIINGFMKGSEQAVNTADTLDNDCGFSQLTFYANHERSLFLSRYQ